MFIRRKFQNIEDVNNQVTFDIIIQNTISVILGEPASGKTFQLKNYSFGKENILFKELVNIELEKINIDSIELIFLDSIDEALRDTSSISMKQLQDKLTKYINKCKEINPSIKFVLTCRQLEWNAYFANSIKEIDNSLKVYKILDLEKAQIDLILTEKQIDNSEFWSFISSNYLDFLLKNILVIFRIINNYNEYKTKTVNYTDIYIDIIKEHLTVKGDDRDELVTQKSLTELIDISSSLATYMILNRQSTISTDDNLSILTDKLYMVNMSLISIDDLKIILNSSLFDKEGNSFSFFHKSMQEFLMAYFINKKSLNLETIKKVFSHEMRFYEEFEEIIIYLTNLNNSFFNEIVNFDPLIFRRHPNLNAEQQEKLLETMLNKLKIEKSIIYGKWNYFDNNSLLNFNKLSNISHIVKENINENHLDKVLYTYLIKLLHYNYHQELEEVIFKILEDYNKSQNNQQKKEPSEDSDVIKGNVKTRELIVDTFVDNFNINCRLYDFMNKNGLLNENIHKISMVSFEAKLFESLYGIKYSNRYSNPKKVTVNSKNYSFEELLQLLLSIPYRDLQYIVPFLKQKDSLKWFEFVKSQKEVNHKISLWAIYGLLLHNNSKETVELVFEYLSRPNVYLHIEKHDIEDMPFEFKQRAENFWEVYFQIDIDNTHFIRSLSEILHISLDDIIKATEKYPIDKYAKYYVPFRLNKEIDKFLMLNRAFESHMQNIWKKYAEQEKKWEEESNKRLEQSESYKKRIQEEKYIDKLCEDSLNRLETKIDFYNVFFCEKLFKEENENKIDEIFSDEKKSIFLDFIMNDFNNDTTYLKLKSEVNSNSMSINPTALLIYLFKSLGENSISKLVNTEEKFEKAFWHVFRYSKMNEPFFVYLVQEQFEYFIELFIDTIKLSLEKSENKDIIHLQDFVTLLEKIHRFDKQNLYKLIELIKTFDTELFLNIESHKRDNLLTILELDIDSYDFIYKIMKQDNYKSSVYLTSLLKLDAEKVIGNYISLYLEEEKYIKKSLWEKFKSLFKKEKIVEVHKYNNPLINPIKINLLMNLLFSISSSKKIDLISDEYLNIIIQDYYEFFKEYEFQEGIVQYPDYDSMNNIIYTIWSILSASSDHILLLKELSSNENDRISNAAKFYLDKAYNQQQKDRTLPNSYYKAIFDSEKKNTKKVVNQGIYIAGNVQGNVTLTKN